MVWRDEEADLWPANQNTSQGDPIVGKERYPDDATDIGTKVYGNDKERDTGRKNTVCSHFMHVLTGTLAEPPQPTVDPSRNRTAEVARKVFNKFYFSVSTARGLLRCLRLSCIPVCLHVADYCFSTSRCRLCYYFSTWVLFTCNIFDFWVLDFQVTCCSVPVLVLGH